MSKKLDDRVAVITGATSGMALATAKLFVDEGAYVFVTGRRQEMLDKAVKEIGKNVTGVQGDSGNLSDLDRLFEIVKRRRAVSMCSLLVQGLVSLTTRSAPLPKKALMIRLTSTFEGPCLPFKRLYRS
jgi:NAD(P)-dependent dehydrogenase (short-subunit alcohol dehydrogenase family)